MKKVAIIGGLLTYLGVALELAKDGSQGAQVRAGQEAALGLHGVDKAVLALDERVSSSADVLLVLLREASGAGKAPVR